MNDTAPHRPGRPDLLGFWLAGLGAVCFSGKAIVIKLGYRHGVDATTFLAMRMLLSLPFFLVALLVVQWRYRYPRLSGRDAGIIVIAGLLGYYIASLLDFIGLEYISAALERLILFTYPSIVLLMTCVLKRRWPARRHVTALLISYAGLLLVFGHEMNLEGAHVAWGSTLVFLSSLAYALYLIVSSSLLQRLGTIRVTSSATLVSATVILVHISLRQPWSIIWQQPPAVWQLSLVNAIFCTVLPVFMVMLAISKIGAPRVAQIGMIGPVVTIAMGAVLLGETFSVFHAAGTALVLAGVALLSGSRAATARV
ncbi:MAG: DMT family transporter [Burkholderiaceae bacterium]